jgi:hypothetical protein
MPCRVPGKGRQTEELDRLVYPFFIQAPPRLFLFEFVANAHDTGRPCAQNSPKGVKETAFILARWLTHLVLRSNRDGQTNRGTLHWFGGTTAEVTL